MNKYQRLVSNTILTAVNQFSSKLLGILMTAYYTRELTTAEYGTMDTVQTTGQFFIPLVLLGIQNAVVRFGLEKSNDKRKVYTCGLAALGCPFAADSPSNQIFPILPMDKARRLMDACACEVQQKVGEDRLCVRFVTSWATKDSDVDALSRLLRSL